MCVTAKQGVSLPQRPDRGITTQVQALCRHYSSQPSMGVTQGSRKEGQHRLQAMEKLANDGFFHILGMRRSFFQFNSFSALRNQPLGRTCLLFKPEPSPDTPAPSLHTHNALKR